MSYVLATSRDWNEVLVRRLEEKTTKAFHLITKKEELTLGKLKKINPRYVFFPHWSHIIPKEIHEAFECIIFHMTDLPYGRGGSPLQNLILRGHLETQISALRCVAELDAGPIYMKRPLSLNGSASEIFFHASNIVEKMIEEIIHKEPIPKPQEGEPTVFSRRVPEQSNLHEAHVSNLNDLFDFIRMLDAEDYPKAFIDVRGYRVEFSHVKIKQDKLIGTFEIHPKNVGKS